MWRRLIGLGVERSGNALGGQNWDRHGVSQTRRNPRAVPFCGLENGRVDEYSGTPANVVAPTHAILPAGHSLEVCITSNVRTGAVASLDAHPVRRLFEAGVPITLNTDDPGIFECDLAGERMLARERFGFRLGSWN